jgi:hypothetical protein
LRRTVACIEQRNDRQRHELYPTLAAAAAACGVNKSTILRAINSGKVSAAKDEHGEWQVEPAELHRVYPPVAERSEAGTDAPQRYASATFRTLWGVGGGIEWFTACANFAEHGTRKIFAEFQEPEFSSAVNGFRRSDRAKGNPCGLCFSRSHLGSPFP